MDLIKNIAGKPAPTGYALNCGSGLAREGVRSGTKILRNETNLFRTPHSLDLFSYISMA
jgi:hypothetical protein